MSTAVINPSSMSDEQKAAHIKAVVTAEGQRLREAHPILKHQNAIGAAILAISWLGIIACGWAYYEGALSAWLCIPLVAIFASLTHELEHDLIHWMYFKKTPWAHHTMMALVWLARPTTINPWARRTLHFNHHKFSGQQNDLEERAITNGERWGIKRLLMTGDNLLSVALRMGKVPAHKRTKLFLSAAAGYFPLGWLQIGIWYNFLGFHAINGAAQLAGTEIVWWSWILTAMQVINFLTVTWIAPNVLRSFSLHFVSSNMHYFGDVEPGNELQQCQVLNVWWMTPFHLFCFNFGATHAIHHFVVKEPFYIRQMSAPVAHKVMREMGVRFNDVGTFGRANRWTQVRA
ncbi:fatty acid desaturase [Nevskia sp.]|uniref:fatty acid desaturase n=1 Tax=Nevskia sp. TaxID=1929292 RepID=UPI0025DF56C6|nr:fatty acid desaturase [Nevskia sp.]